MDWGTIAVAACSAGAGAFGKSAASKLVSLMKSPKTPAKQKLFPNGEREEIIEQIDKLRGKYRDLTLEIDELKRLVKRIAEHLEIPL